MKNKNYLIALLLIGIMGSFKQCFFKKTSTGLQYKTIHQGKGPKPQEGEIMLFDMLYKTEKDDTLFNSADQEIPLAVQYSDEVYQKDGGINEAISMLQNGDQMIFKINAKKILGTRFEQAAEKYHLAEDAHLLVHIHVKDVLSQAAYQEWMEKQILAMEIQQREKAAKQLQIDLEIIDQYLKENNITAQTTNSGLRYVIDQPGTKDAKRPQPGDMVKVNYVGKMLDGQVFDTSIEEVAKNHNLHNPMRTYEPLSFQVGKGQVIPGWDEGLLLLTKGSKAHFFIPSPLAYGSYAMGDVIKANSILVFEVELVDISK